MSNAAEKTDSIQTDVPPEYSGRGDNVVIIGCDLYSKRHYCACVRINTRYQSGDPDQQNLDCNEAIRRKNCPASKMMAEEKKAGKALYYIPRAPAVTPGWAASTGDLAEGFNSPGFQYGWNTVGRRMGLDTGQTLRPNSSRSTEVGRSNMTSMPKREPRKTVAVEKPKSRVTGSYADLVNKMMEEEGE